MALIYPLKETRWKHTALNTQQVVLTRADSRYEQVFLIKAWMLPRVRMPQTDNTESDESRTEVSGVQGEGTRGGEKNSHGIEENTTNEKNNKSGKEEQKPGTEIGEGETEQEI